jgi:hypothetical protein
MLSDASPPRLVAVVDLVNQAAFRPSRAIDFGNESDAVCCKNSHATKQLDNAFSLCEQLAY